MTFKPKVGLTMRLELETGRFYLGRDYSEAIQAAGGLPVHIPLIPDEDYIRSVIGHLDGVLLPGCDSDVDPAFYGEAPHPRLKRVIPQKDKTDMLVLAAASERNLPVLAICYGMQALNVMRGGSLIQDIESQVENSIKHEQGLPASRNSHAVAVGKDSFLARVGATDNTYVNSHHHQGVRNLGSGLTATAWAPDGIVECIEDFTQGKFVLGVQWHPELSWRTDELSRNIFQKFILACMNEGDSAENRYESVDTEPAKSSTHGV